ncbi:hypothetical protein [Chlorobaculum sp. 24CR]|nr:hypothetical protein [Chlorobaculum sp. 24CR]
MTKDKWRKLVIARPDLSGRGDPFFFAIALIPHGLPSRFATRNDG